MATKTISIDLEAYERLKSVRRGPRDSFSQVIRRAHWEDTPKTCGGLLAALSTMPRIDEQVLRYLDATQEWDSPPDDPRA